MRAIGLVLLTAGVCLGQAAPADEILLIPFQVTQRDAFVADLSAEEVELRIDGTVQKPAVFEGPRTTPRTIPTDVIFLFDCDRTVVANSGLSPRVFHEQLLDGREHVRVAVYGFGGGLVRLTAPTRDEAVLRKTLDASYFVHPLGTFLLDHIREVVGDLAGQGRAVRMLVVLSDGVSDTAEASQSAKRQRFEATVVAAQRANVSIHPIVLKEPFGTRAGTSASSTAAPSRGGIPRAGTAEDMAMQTDLRSLGDFTNLGSATGGQSQEVLSGSRFLPGLLKSIAKLVQDSYVVGFVPARSEPPKRHRVEIRLKDRNRGRVVVGIRNLTY
jgi:hypothetical protein